MDRRLIGRRKGRVIDHHRSLDDLRVCQLCSESAVFTYTAVRHMDLIGGASECHRCAWTVTSSSSSSYAVDSPPARRFRMLCLVLTQNRDMERSQRRWRRPPQREVLPYGRERSARTAVKTRQYSLGEWARRALAHAACWRGWCALGVSDKATGHRRWLMAWPSPDLVQCVPGKQDTEKIAHSMARSRSAHGGAIVASRPYKEHEDQCETGGGKEEIAWGDRKIQHAAHQANRATLCALPDRSERRMLGSIFNSGSSRQWAGKGSVGDLYDGKIKKIRTKGSHQAYLHLIATSSARRAVPRRVHQTAGVAAHGEEMRARVDAASTHPQQRPAGRPELAQQCLQAGSSSCRSPHKASALASFVAKGEQVARCRDLQTASAHGEAAAGARRGVVSDNPAKVACKCWSCRTSQVSSARRKLTKERDRRTRITGDASAGGPRPRLGALTREHAKMLTENAARRQVASRDRQPSASTLTAPKIVRARLRWVVRPWRPTQRPPYVQRTKTPARQRTESRAMLDQNVRLEAGRAREPASNEDDVGEGVGTVGGKARGLDGGEALPARKQRSGRAEGEAEETYPGASSGSRPRSTSLHLHGDPRETILGSKQRGETYIQQDYGSGGPGGEGCGQAWIGGAGKSRARRAGGVVDNQARGGGGCRGSWRREERAHSDFGNSEGRLLLPPSVTTSIMRIGLFYILALVLFRWYMYLSDLDARYAFPIKEETDTERVEYNTETGLAVS
ncbi:hypothetical protein FA95DRAFT_1577758 [Auriscalpium vulgare]|uniref:Uncharacterized protein n=1 Tax=Auriscalpium vulgare TaxID=40419 RepID=A0ACB8R5M0_9AGAM|nr:hypothetical protein FA95DRAFT_1577758 [Auriscalpium vulgare]